MMNKYRKNTHMPDDGGRFPLFPKLVATSFGFGFLPVAPGTWGALFGILVWLPLYVWASPLTTVIVTALAVLLFSVLGVWASNVAERYWGHDPVVACIDETVGQWIALMPVLPAFPWWEIVVALALFRFFDIFKPLGIRATEKLPGGIGMMADDVVAGLYSAVILIAFNYFVTV